MDKLTKETSASAIAKAIEGFSGIPAEKKEGRGIVIGAGGTRLSINAWVNVRMLRELGCELPVEMWYLGSHEYSEGFARLIEPYGVTLVNAANYLDTYPHAELRGWELKPYAIAHSKFAETMYLDADNVAVADPTYLFDDERYKKVGTMFWPDFGRLAPERPAWPVFGVEYRDEPEVESGQSIINKNHPGVWRCLELANWLMQNSPFFFTYVHGDKEIFHLSWRRLDQPYVMPDRGIDALPGVMCQHDLDGTRIFQHRNMRKWQFVDNEKTPGFIHEDRCIELVDELRRKWSPCTSDPPSDEDMEIIESLHGKKFAYVRVCHDHREITLNRDGSISKGGESRERLWTVRCDENGVPVMMVVGDDGQVTMRLTKSTVGQAEFWSGAWLVHERMPVMMIPLNS